MLRNLELPQKATYCSFTPGTVAIFTSIVMNLLSCQEQTLNSQHNDPYNSLQLIIAKIR